MISVGPGFNPLSGFIFCFFNFPQIGADVLRPELTVLHPRDAPPMSKPLLKTSQLMPSGSFRTFGRGRAGGEARAPQEILPRQLYHSATLDLANPSKGTLQPWELPKRGQLGASHNPVYQCAEQASM